VTQSTVDTNLLQTLQILTQLVIQVIGKELAELAILAILLTIEEPVGNLVLTRILHDGDDTLQVLLTDIAGTHSQINVSLTAHHRGKTTATALDGGQGKVDLLATVNVGVEDTENVLEAGLLGNVQRLQREWRGWMDERDGGGLP